MHRLLVAPIIIIIGLFFISPIKGIATNENNSFSPKHLLYLQRGCFLKWLDGDYLKSISYCDQAINYLPNKQKGKVVTSYEIRAMSKQALNDSKGACQDWEKAIDLGLTPMPKYWLAFSTSFRNKRLRMEHSQAYKETQKEVPYRESDKELELKQIKLFCS